MTSRIPDGSLPAESFVDFDYSWNALLRPGEATEFFEPDPLPTIDIHAPTFRIATAWWLAELSRLVYRQVAGSQSGDAADTRQQILAQAGLEESRFLDRRGTQCAMIVPNSTSLDSFGVVVFRGTSKAKDWRNNLDARFVAREFARVHRGFQLALDAVQDDLRDAIRHIDGPLFFTGHSLGGAVATLAATRHAPHAVYTFGSPRVGDADLVGSFETTSVYRVVNGADLVTRVPPAIGANGFRHVGELHYLARDGRHLVDPPRRDVAADRANSPNRWEHRRWNQPPLFLADHAPVNYVAHLQKQLDVTG